MFKAGYVSLQDIPRDKDHAPSRTIYTWRANNDVAVGQMGGDIYKSALNTRLFYEHHFEANKQVRLNLHIPHNFDSENAWPLQVHPEVSWCWRSIACRDLGQSCHPALEGRVCGMPMSLCTDSAPVPLLDVLPEAWPTHRQGGITVLQLMEKVKKGLANDQDGEDCETAGQQLRIVVSKGLAIDRQVALMNDY